MKSENWLLWGLGFCWRLILKGCATVYHYSLLVILVRLIQLPITKTYLYNFDQFKPHFYIVKLGFTGVYIIFLISAQKHRLWYSLEPPHRGGSKEYLQSMFWTEIRKISEFFVWFFPFLVVKFSIYLNRRVFVMLLVKDGFLYRTQLSKAPITSWVCS